MKKRSLNCLLLSAAALAFSWSAPCAHAQVVSFVGKTVDATNYGDVGLDLGNDGYWFPQFNAAAPITGALVDDNDVNSFPNWVLPNFDKTDANYSFGLGGLGDVFSEGGDTAWNNFILPNNATGLSGSIVDPQTQNNSNNTIRQLLLGHGTPPQFLLHTIADNTNGEHDPARRIRWRLERGGSDIGDADVTTQVADFNGTADVYTYRITGALPGDILKMQLNSRVAGEMAGIGGLMFDVTIPEPSSIAMLALAGVGFAAFGRRLRRRG